MSSVISLRCPSRGDFRARQLRGGTKCDCGSVPSIDRDDRGGEIDELLFRKMSARLIVDLIRHVTVANLRHHDPLIVSPQLSKRLW